VAHSVPAHALVITRTSGGTGFGATSQGSTMTRTIKTSSGGGGGGDLSFNEGQFAMVTATGVNAVKDTREQERKDMQDLNDRFANYIEKVPHQLFNSSPSVCRLVWVNGQLAYPPTR